jgi:methylated-DNA-[protein]-cysteine S-methyltransferase
VTRIRPLAGYEVESVTVRAEGICSECKDYRRGLADGAQTIRDHETFEAAHLNGLSCTVADSAVGQLGLVASTRGIVRIAFSDHADFDAITAAAGVSVTPTRLRNLDAALREYLAGSEEPLTDAIDWDSVGEATSQTLRRVGKIAFGQGRSYVEIRATLNSYDCGRAMGMNPLPLLIPCHRVRCGSDRPQVYVGGLARLQFLERLEASG